MKIAYITIQYKDHDYKATVSTTEQFEDYISKEARSFKIVKTEILDYKYSQKIAGMLNRVSRFSNSLNMTATA